MKPLLQEIRHNPLLWLLAFVPVVFVAAKLKHDAHTLLFILSVLAIVPLAALTIVFVPQTTKPKKGNKS